MRKPSRLETIGALLVFGALAWHFLPMLAPGATKPGESPEAGRSFDPLSPDAHRNLALALQSQGRVEAAERLRRAALLLQGGAAARTPGASAPESRPPEEEERGEVPFPDGPDGTGKEGALAARAVRLARNGRLDEALETAEKAIERDGETAANLVALGYVRMFRAEPELAEGLLTRAIEMDRDCAAAWLGRGVLNLRRRRFSGAVRDLSHACLLATRNASWKIQLSVAQCASGDVDDALRTLEQALELTPGSPEIYSRIADCLLRGGREEEARRWYSAALRLRGEGGFHEGIEEFVEGRAASEGSGRSP